MSSRKQFSSDSLFTGIALVVVFLVNLLLVRLFNTKTMTPMIFVLGVFLVSWKTQGYFFGIAASLISVLAVNWAFTYPYWAFDLISPECIPDGCCSTSKSRRQRGGHFPQWRE